MIIAIPVTADGRVGQTWGKAPEVAIADADRDGVRDWNVHQVRWDVSHDEGSHGAHHARVVTFLREHRVDAVAAEHVGPGMVRMLETMGIELVTGARGDAREVVLALAQDPERD